MTSPPLTFTATVLDAPDAHALSEFYRALLGWSVDQDEPDWVKIIPPGGGTALSFQTTAGYRPPVWPAAEGTQQMMLHLDFETTDLTASVSHALTLGATLSPHQPQEDVRVMLDPAGHPFCFWIRTEE